MFRRLRSLRRGVRHALLRPAARAAAFSASVAAAVADGGDRSIPALLALPAVDDEGRPVPSREMIALVVRAQENLCAVLERAEREAGGDAVFRRDEWNRDMGGGGITMVLEGSEKVEKAAVNVSVLYGTLGPAQAAAMRDKLDESLRSYLDEMSGKGLDVPFFACGLSTICHPATTHPTAHANIRFFQIEDAREGRTGSWAWMGGGADLSPMGFLEDRHAELFHESMRDACGDSYPYPEYKANADKYFFLDCVEDGGIHRGVGGLFFDALSGEEPSKHLAFLRTVIESYTDVYSRILSTPVSFSPRDLETVQKWRSHYVLFNLLRDRGTKFGLAPGSTARTASVLASLPPVARFPYGSLRPGEGCSPQEANCYAVLKEPKEWVRQ